MNLKDIGEFGFIRQIRQGCIADPASVVKGIGDDAAVYTVKPGQLSLLTTDLLVEGVHFLREAISGRDIGYKALAVNLSDIAAMGGTPNSAFISIGIPSGTDVAYLEDIYRGIKDLAGEFSVNILGGDTTGSKSGLIINIAVTGTVAEKECLYRHAAKPGDIIAVTGYPGESKAGLHLILNGIEPETALYKRLIKAHNLPKPYANEGRFLARQKGMHAAIDISDGLTSDLGHILEESRAGAVLEAGNIPLSDDLVSFCTEFDFDPLGYAISGGEDYLLLVTIDSGHFPAIQDNYFCQFGTRLFPIGTITTERGCTIKLPEGTSKNLQPMGWDHFK